MRSVGYTALILALALPLSSGCVTAAQSLYAKAPREEGRREEAAKRRLVEQEAARERAGRETLQRRLDKLRSQTESTESGRRQLRERIIKLEAQIAELASAETNNEPACEIPQKTWAVVLGIAEYRYTGHGPLKRLDFADKDARDFATSLKQLGWSKDSIYLLTDAQATEKKISYALATWLRRAGPDDLILLFWAGHAWPDPADPSRAYFACYDSKPSDPSSCWRMDRVRQVLEERGARNVVVIADTCHAGKIIRSGEPRAISVVPALNSMQAKEEIPKGWVFIVSADPDLKSYEDKAWSNGALTHVLLEGLRGAKADGYKSAGTKDGTVTLGELRAYITDRMAEESLNLLGARLTPLFFTTSGNPEIWDLTLETK